MKFSLATTLFGVAVMIVSMFMIIRKSFFGLLVLLGLALVYFVLTIVSEAFKIHGKNVQSRNRHP